MENDGKTKSAQTALPENAANCAQTALPENAANRAQTSLPERLADARERLAEKEDRWALEAGAAADFLELSCGLRLWKPAIPHAWAMAKAAQAGTLGTYEVNMVTAFILSRTAEEVRNSLMPRLERERLPEVVAEAERAMMDAGAAPSEVLEAIVRLTREAFPPKRAAATA